MIYKGLYSEIYKLVDSKKLSLELFYLAEVRSCVNLKLEGQIEVVEFEKIKNFFKEASIERNVAGSLKKVLKLSNK